MKKALLIEFDLNSGKRAGDINPNDPKLQCYGWQDLESVPAKEIRLVEDDRDLSQYEGVPGVAILHGEEEINQVISAMVPERFFVQDEKLFLEHLRQKSIALDDYRGQNQQAILRDLHGKGIVGINKLMPRKM